MSLSPDQQFHDLIKKSSHPLVLLTPYPSRDDIATALALSLFIERLGKSVTLAADRIDVSLETLAFITHPKEVLPALSGARDFVLSFNTSYNKVLGVRTAQEGDEYRIYLTPEKGTIDPRDFSFIPAHYRFDVAIIIGAPDKEHLGKIFEDNPDIFYEVPLINIDTSSQNELFGQINLVDITASSKSEILTELLERTVPTFITESIAEALLAGIMSATESFQKKNTTPKALKAAAELIGHGADQQKIVRALYRTEPLPLLKLWGRALSHIQWDEKYKLILAPISLEDLVQSRAHTHDLSLVLEKIRGSFSLATTFVVFFQESPIAIRGLLKCQNTEMLQKIHLALPESEIQGDILVFPIAATSLEIATSHIQSCLIPLLEQTEN
ncbi:MAG: hypothetical protein KBC83_01485 [Candidatus Moranbacteria bacterium]|jgi:nanoRNase/pAp phosphatase (c-di-AMP/oligoRNAs hydrolase)|nr:hypothetical protein [Candidatus Moranbacteria bacterium]MBP9801322.1 hypothetical protein [Candidatus Moranbacteria bacterium]